MSKGFPLVLGFVVVAFSSCATSRQTILGEDCRTIAIPVFQNDTMQYGLEESITASVRHAFIRDRRLRVTERPNADVILEGRISDVEIQPLSFTDLDRAVGYDMTMVVHARIVESGESRVVAPESAFQVRGPFLLSNQPSAERTRDVGRMLAEDMISRFLDGW
jgi:hypothetical protein